MQRLEEVERVSYIDVWGKGIPGIGKSQCKGCMTEEHLVYFGIFTKQCRGHCDENRVSNREESRKESRRKNLEGEQAI